MNVLQIVRMAVVLAFHQDYLLVLRVKKVHLINIFTYSLKRVRIHAQKRVLLGISAILYLICAKNVTHFAKPAPITQQLAQVATT